MRWSTQFPTVESDYTQLERVLRREQPDRIPVIELFADHDFISTVLGYGPEAVAADQDYADWQRYWLWRIEFQKLTAPDFINVTIPGLYYETRKVAFSTNTASMARDPRCWVQESDGIITTREAYEAYPWPESSFSSELFDFVAENIPPGMGMIVTSSGVLEWTMWLMGYEPLSLALYDDPELVRDVTNRIGQRFVRFYEQAVSHDAVRAVWLGDDMGFKTGPMISPQHLHTYIFPWHQRLADVAHQCNKPILLHSCGNLDSVMDALIDDVGIDAKHSFEDVIEPVGSFKRRFGHRIAVLGGIDIDVLSRQTPNEVRDYTRRTLEACAPGGGYALGSGNSVTNYVEIENYLAMLDELARFNRDVC